MHERPPRWDERPIKEVRFVDDLTGAEKIDITSGTSLITTRKEERTVHAPLCQKYLSNIQANTSRLGMRVNEDKTQLLCVTSSINYQVRSSVDIGEETLISGDSLKVIGFTFGRRPGAAEHTKNLRKKYGSRAYSIRHLKKAGISEETLTAVYKSFIRPVFDYASPAFHTILTDDQAEGLERMQRSTLKTIYGFDVPYRECLEKSGLPTLRQRRQTLFENFARKAYDDDHYNAKWFQRKEKSTYGLRREEKVVQKFANCDRLRNAPLYRIRQFINESHPV